jgi:multicomponent Na+:H+ antiporter subunit G
MREWITAGLLVIGGTLALLAAVGVVRLPDLFTRMQASTKAATLGIGCILLALAVYFNDLGVTVRVLLVIAFLFLTAPVAAHMIGRAAYFDGVPLWEGTLMDELRDRYNRHRHTLESPPPNPAVPRTPGAEGQDCE